MAHDHGNHPRRAEGSHPHSADEWNDKYSSAERLWTSDANPALIREVVDLTPGRALDVGTGEGADSQWLADQGWTVVGVDISQVAIDRAAEIDSRDAITWQQTDLTVDDVEPAAFDLVNLHYFPIAIGREDVARKLVDAVAPGGTLLVVAHAPEGMLAHGHDPAEYFQPADFAERFADRLEVVTLETVPRGRPAGGNTAQQHVDDAVLKATAK